MTTYLGLVIPSVLGSRLITKHEPRETSWKHIDELSFCSSDPFLTRVNAMAFYNVDDCNRLLATANPTGSSAIGTSEDMVPSADSITEFAKVRNPHARADPPVLADRASDLPAVVG